MNKIFGNIENYEILFSEIVGAEVSEDIVITKKAIDEMMKNFLDTFGEESDYFIRLTVKTNSNVSKSYAIIFDNKITDNDKIFELRKIKIVVDKKSIFYFLGITIDFIENNNGKGYLFINNLDEYQMMSNIEKYSQTVDDSKNSV